MVNRKSFPASLFGIAFIAALLLGPSQSRAAMQTFEKEYTYTASELDSKSSCRILALEQVKRILLQELGVYVESVFNDKASTDGRTKDEVRREITTLSAGVASTEVVDEKWDGQTYWLKARIKADPDDVAKKIKALRQDKEKAKQLEESQTQIKELAAKIEQMKEELSKKAVSVETAKQYSDTAQMINAVRLVENARDLLWNGKKKEALAAANKALEINPNYADAYEVRGEINYRDSSNPNFLDNAMTDYNKAIAIDPLNKWALNCRAYLFSITRHPKQAIENYSNAIKVDPPQSPAKKFQKSEKLVITQ